MGIDGGLWTLDVLRLTLVCHVWNQERKDDLGGKEVKVSLGGEKVQRVVSFLLFKNESVESNESSQSSQSPTFLDVRRSGGSAGGEREVQAGKRKQTKIRAGNDGMLIHNFKTKENSKLCSHRYKFMSYRAR